LVFPQFLKTPSINFRQIWGISKGPQGGPLCRKTVKSDEGILCNRGSKKIFSRVPTPKPEVELVGEEGGICRGWGVVSGSEKSFGKFPRVTEIFGVKEKHLAPPSGET